MFLTNEINLPGPFAGGLLFLFTPLGSVLSSLTLGRLGHKACMLITNVPYIASQLMLVCAGNVATLYACSMLMGLSVGFAGGPCSGYIGEVCEPKLRGALMSAANVFYYVGSLVFTLIYAATVNWRHTVLVGLSMPAVNIAILLLVTDAAQTRVLNLISTDKFKPTDFELSVSSA